jgi:SOS-response transcriptional repressor LexA
MLTQREAEVLTIVDLWMAGHNGVAPSYEEIAEAMVPPSRKSAVHGWLVALEEKGYIKRMKNRKRALAVMRRATDPESASLPNYEAKLNGSLVTAVQRLVEVLEWVEANATQPIVRGRAGTAAQAGAQTLRMAKQGIVA